jgi:hypothetical protein
MRILPAFALATALVLGGCQNPDGSTNMGGTLALGAGLGIAAGLLAANANDGGSRHRGHDHGYRSHGRYPRGPVYGQGYGHGPRYGQAYGHGRRGW